MVAWLGGLVSAYAAVRCVTLFHDLLRKVI
jgi:hypothetical protein